MSVCELVQVATETEWRDYHAIRRIVLFEAKGRFFYDASHEDEYKENKFPLLLKLNDEGIGTTRLDVRDEATGVIRLVAIREDLQGQGYGRMLQNEVESFARKKGVRILLVNAAPEAVVYYKKMGFENFEWDASELAGIAADCIQMRKVFKITSEEFDRIFDEGGDIMPYLDLSTATRINQSTES